MSKIFVRFVQNLDTLKIYSEKECALTLSEKEMNNFFEKKFCRECNL